MKEEEGGGGFDARTWVDDEGLEHRHVWVASSQLKRLSGVNGKEKARYGSGYTEHGRSDCGSAEQVVGGRYREGGLETRQGGDSLVELSWTKN